MLGLRLGPAAEMFVDGDEVELLELREVLRIGGFRVGRAVMMLGGERLSFGRVEEAQIGLG